MNYITPRQGSSLVAVMLIATVFAVSIGAAISYMLTEQRLSHSNRLHEESKLVAESVLEYGIAQLQRTFNRQGSVVDGAFNPFVTGSSAPVLDDNFYDIYQVHGLHSRIVLPEAPYTASQIESYDTFFVASQLSPTVMYYFDPTDPGNENNPLNGITARMHTIDVYAKGTVSDPRGGTRSAYVKQTFEIFDQSLFDHAVFYSANDLEIAPGANMTWAGTGPIHSNHDIYVGTSATLNFRVRVSSAGNFYARRHSNSGQGGQSGTINMLHGITGADVSLSVDGTYVDSERSGFRNLSSERFRGGLMTIEHGVHERYPVGIGELSSVFEGIDGNWEHHLIGPPTPRQTIATDIGLNDEQRAVLETVEDLKFSNRAGLVIEFTDPTGNTNDVRIFTYQMNGDEYALDAQNNRIPIELSLPAGDRFWNVEPYATTGFGNNRRVSSGLFDLRQGESSSSNADGQINLVSIDVGKLRELLEANPDVWRRTDTTPYHPENWWNGGVYVRMPNQEGVGTREDRIVPSNSQWAVRLYNGAVLPNPFYTRSEQIYGMTLATNSALYVQGDFNAPTGGGTSTEPENRSHFAEEGNEVPAALIADAITILSNSWNSANSFRHKDHRIASNTVISAGFITGNVASGSLGYNHYSGGVENFPRLLENWSGRTLTYRGSMVMLFNSEVQKKVWSGTGTVYDPPSRNWGYHAMFGEGFRPPMDTGPRLFRRRHFREMSSADFEAEVADVLNSYR